MWFLQPGISMLDVLMRIFATLVIIFLVMPLHEYAHGWVAKKLGDRTAELSGHMTLNPMSHFDPLGAFSVLVFDIGWAKSVPIDSKNFKHPRRDLALTALAGPLTHVIAAILGTVLLNSTAFLAGISFIGPIQKFLSYYIIINISLAGFNFLPIPPFDGYKILECLIPNKYLLKYYRYYPLILLFLLGLMLFGFFEIPLMFIRQSLYGFVMKLGNLPFMVFMK